MNDLTHLHAIMFGGLHGSDYRSLRISESLQYFHRDTKLFLMDATDYAIILWIDYETSF